MWIDIIMVESKLLVCSEKVNMSMLDVHYLTLYN
jgi:hypothetical protein